MKINAVRYGADRNPVEFDVTLTTKQMGIIYTLAGHMAPAALSEDMNTGIPCQFTDACQTELVGTIIDTEAGPETITAVWFGNGRERLVIESEST